MEKKKRKFHGKTENMGRPLLGFEKRSKVVICRITPTERARLKGEAKRTGLTMSEVLMKPWRKGRK